MVLGPSSKERLWSARDVKQIKAEAHCEGLPLCLPLKGCDFQNRGLLGTTTISIWEGIHKHFPDLSIKINE